MISIAPTNLTDSYPLAKDGAVLGPSGLGLGLDLTVANNPAFVRLFSLHDPMLGIGGGVRLSDEFYLPPTTKSWTGAIGFAARNAVAGSVAVVAADVWERSDPTPLGGIQFSGTLSPSGTFTPVTQIGQELAYVEYTAGVVANNVAENAATQIVSSGIVNYDGTTINVAFYSPSLVTGGTPLACGISLWDGVTDLGRLFDATIVNQPVVNLPGPLFRRLTPTAGNHTYRAMIWNTSVGNFIAEAGLGGVGTIMPGYIKVTKA